MSVCVRIHTTGGVEVLGLEEVTLPLPGPGQVVLEQQPIGVNPLDLLHRSGAAPIALPSALGLEGAGRVAAIGDGVHNVAVGDLVGCATGPLGAYASARLYPAGRLVRLPSTLAPDKAAALLFKGITAQYLLKSTAQVGRASRIVIYGAAGALGQLMVQSAKHLGAFVVGVVSKAQSVERARCAGCDAVFVFNADTLPRRATWRAAGSPQSPPTWRSTTVSASPDSHVSRCGGLPGTVANNQSACAAPW